MKKAHEESLKIYYLDTMHMTNWMGDGSGYSYSFPQPQFVNGDLSIFNAQKVMLPINSGGHWILMVVKMKSNSLYLCDSLGIADADIYFDACIQFLKDHAIRTTGCTLQELCSNTNNWSRHVVDSPKQANGTDCGVFTCINMFCDTFGLPMRMSSDIADHMRSKIGVCLIRDGF
jgi:sentrin-specific protease 1